MPKTLKIADSASPQALASATLSSAATSSGVTIVSNCRPLISAVGYGVSIAGSGVVRNSSIIDGVGGVYLGGGSVVNLKHGSIAATGTAGAGILINGAAGSVTNSGRISAAGTSGNAVSLADGGSVANFSGGVIAGNNTGVLVTGAAVTVTNSGRISGTGAYSSAVTAESGGSITNYAGGSISAAFGVSIFGAPGTISNKGQIIATGSSSSGVYLFSDSQVQNSVGGRISGGYFGVFAGASSTITNAGTITSTATTVPSSLFGDGIFFAGNGDSVLNIGLIRGLDNGVIAEGTATVSNSGTIIGTGHAGVSLNGTVTNIVTNSSGARIYGGSTGIYIPTGTVSNDGTISGGAGGIAVQFGNDAANRLIVEQDAVFIGIVNGGGGTLEFAGSSKISGVGTGALNNFAVVDVDAGVSWQPTGVDTVATLVNDGIVGISCAFDVSTAIDPASTGVFKIGGGVTLEIAADTGSLDRIQFVPHSTLAIDNAALFGSHVGAPTYAGPQLQNFVAGDSIDLKNFAALGASFGYTAATGVLQVTDAAHQTASVAFQTSTLGSGSFHLSSDGGSGLVITHS